MAGVDAPRVHDVSQIMLDNRDRMPDPVRPHLEKLAEYSRSLRRDRDLAFYGSEDLTPMDFYREKDAEQARRMARETVDAVIGLLDD